MLSHDRRTNPIREIESRREEKGQGSISDLDPSGNLKFRIPSEPESSFHSVASESFRAEQNRENGRERYRCVLILILTICDILFQHFNFRKI